MNILKISNRTYVVFDTTRIFGYIINSDLNKKFDCEIYILSLKFQTIVLN